WLGRGGRHSEREECGARDLFRRNVDQVEGDQLAMRMLFNRRRVALYRWLLQLVGDKALAEDLSFPKIISGRIGGAARTGSGAGPLDRQPRGDSSSRRHFVECERETRRAIAAGERDMLAQHTD